VATRFSGSLLRALTGGPSGALRVGVILRHQLGHHLYKYRQMRLAQGESARFIELFWDSRNLTSIHDASRELKAGSVAQVFRAGYEEPARHAHAKSDAGEALTTGWASGQRGERMRPRRWRSQVGKR
jgi:hypothetical protein